MIATVVTKPRAAYFTQWAAQFFAAAELSRRGYMVSFPLGNAPLTDLQVTSPDGHSFPVEVKGLKSPNWWIVKRPIKGRERFYVFVLAPVSAPFSLPRYFILSGDRLSRIHEDDPKWPGMTWGKVLPFENCWDTLPE
jgi:hypothetical protein